MPSDRLCLAGTGRESTAAAIRAAQRAADLGADAVLVRTPSYFKPLLTSDAFVAHYTAVADASPVPVVLYNYTALTGVTLGVDAVARLAEHPNVIGMKESGSDLKFPECPDRPDARRLRGHGGVGAGLLPQPAGGRPRAASWRWPRWCPTSASICTTWSARVGSTRRAICSGG